MKPFTVKEQKKPRYLGLNICQHWDSSDKMSVGLKLRGDVHADCTNYVLYRQLKGEGGLLKGEGGLPHCLSMLPHQCLSGTSSSPPPDPTACPSTHAWVNHFQAISPGQSAHRQLQKISILRSRMLSINPFRLLVHQGRCRLLQSQPLLSRQSQQA